MRGKILIWKCNMTQIHTTWTGSFKMDCQWKVNLKKIDNLYNSCPRHRFNATKIIMAALLTCHVSTLRNYECIIYLFFHVFSNRISLIENGNTMNDYVENFPITTFYTLNHRWHPNQHFQYKIVESRERKMFLVIQKRGKFTEMRNILSVGEGRGRSTRISGVGESDWLPRYSHPASGYSTLYLRYDLFSNSPFLLLHKQGSAYAFFSLTTLPDEWCLVNFHWIFSVHVTLSVINLQVVCYWIFFTETYPRMHLIRFARRWLLNFFG